jgi:predicted ATPase
MSDDLYYRYLLEAQLAVTDIGDLYRAIDRVSSHPSKVLFHRILRPLDELQISDNTQITELRLAKELHLLSSLRHPHLLEMRDYGFLTLDNGARLAFYTSPDLDNSQSLTEAAHNLSLVAKIQLVGQMLQAVGYLHRRGILHLNLRPDNVRVLDGKVYVQGFGLRVVPTIRRQESDVVGVVDYWSPEQIQGQGATPQSDLYAVGVMLYELISENFPYSRTTDLELMNGILYNAVDTKRLPVPATIQLLLSKLLSKDPALRSIEAYDILGELSTAMNVPLGEEAEMLREVYLKMYRMIGRDVEMVDMNAKVTDMLNSRGNAIALIGDSGIGKSRLALETGILATSKGTLVIQGKGKDKPTIPYALWAEPLRQLLGRVTLTEAEQAIFAPFMTDEAPKTREAFFAAWLDILKRFTKQQALLFILDDIDYASEECLVLLEKTLTLCHQHRLMIITTLRTEGQALLTQFPDMEQFPLKKFSVRYISELTQKVLGPAGELPIVNALLYRETEGNIYFLAEVMRALAEQVGDVNQIGIKTLPEQLFAGGLDEAITRRLERVQEYDQDMLSLAALIGYELDLELLSNVNPHQDLERWLLRCAEVGVLEVQAERWMFTHDRLHQGALNRIEPNDLPIYEKRIANTLENLYSDKAFFQGHLASHWLNARQPDKALMFFVNAGDVASQHYAPELAQRLYEQALTLNPTPQYAETIRQKISDLTKVEQPTPEKQPTLWELSQEYTRLGAYSEALSATSQVLQEAFQQDERPQIAPALEQLGRIYLGMENLSSVEQALQLANTLAETEQLSELQCMAQLGLAHLYDRYSLYSEALAIVESLRMLAEAYNYERVLVHVYGMDAYFSSLIGIKDEDDALADLQAMSERYPNYTPMRALVSYYMWRIRPDNNAEQQLALTSFKAQYESTHDAEARYYYQQLGGEGLEEYTEYPSLPKVENVDLEALLPAIEKRYG